MFVKRCSCVSGLILIAALPAAAQDLTIVSQRSREGKPPTTETTYLTSSKMRLETGDGNQTIIDYATGEITTIEPKRKEYWVMTRADMDAMAAQMKAMQAQMQSRMQNMPPEVRERMSGMMGAAAQAVKVERGTGGRTVAGYACENWIITMGNFSRRETCVTTQLQFPAGFFDGMKAMSERMRAGGGPMGGGMAALWDKFREMKGFPLASADTVTIMGHPETTKTEVTEVRKGAVPDSVFQIPADYKKVPSPLSKMGQHPMGRPAPQQ